MSETKGYLPPRCASCSWQLDKVNWRVKTVYLFNIETGRYEQNKIWGDGEGGTQCPHCGADISFEPGFEEGPLNYKIDPERTCFNCKHIERDENGEPIYRESIENYRCLQAPNGRADAPRKARGPSECYDHQPYCVKKKLYHGENEAHEFWETEDSEYLIFRDPGAEQWLALKNARVIPGTPTVTLCGETVEECIEELKEICHVNLVKDTTKRWLKNKLGKSAMTLANSIYHGGEEEE